MAQHIALVGPMYSGKSSIAKELEAHHGYTKLALADAVKDDGVSMLNHWIILHNPWRRYHGLPTLSLVNRAYLDQPHVKAKMRPFWQWLGTEWGREFVGPDTIWLDIFLAVAKDLHLDGQSVVCDDVRFLNEAEALRAAGFLIVRVTRPENERLASVGAGTGLSGHASETELASIVPDLYVKNDFPGAPAALAAGLVVYASTAL